MLDAALPTELPPGRSTPGNGRTFIGGAHKRAGLLFLLGLTYATTCGGPYGIENFVSRVGPGFFLLLLFLTPWFWGVPLALVTAEMSTRRPVQGGYYRWARHYLGEFWGFQSGIWSLLSSLLDNTLYPVLIASALRHAVPGISGVWHWLVAVGVILFLTYLNYRGIRIAGATSVVLSVFLILPMVWIVLAGFAQARWNPLFPLTAPDIDLVHGFGVCLALSMWLYSGYGDVSTAAEEMENPARNIPLALLLVTPFTILSYALPTTAGLASVGGWQTWSSGEFTAIGHALGGPVLGQWALLGNVAANAVIFLAFLLWWSRLAWSMADDGYLPRFLTRLHPRRGTPHRVLWTYAVVYSVLAAFPFESLLVAEMWLVGAYAILLHASLIKARRIDGNRTGFQVPGGQLGLWLNALVPITTWMLLLIFTAGQHWLLGMGMLLAGPVLYAVSRRFCQGSVRHDATASI